MDPICPIRYILWFMFFRKTCLAIFGRFSIIFDIFDSVILTFTSESWPRMNKVFPRCAGLLIFLDKAEGSRPGKYREMQQNSGHMKPKGLGPRSVRNRLLSCLIWLCIWIRIRIFYNSHVVLRNQIQKTIQIMMILVPLAKLDIFVFIFERNQNLLAIFGSFLIIFVIFDPGILKIVFKT